MKEKIMFVDDYESAKFYDALPRFSKEVFDYLYSSKVNISEKAIIADVGCGTGRLTIDFLERGNIVYGIDPDENMRKICLNKCINYNNHQLKLIDGTAEKMNIHAKSVDFVIVSQSFHRFNLSKFKKECKRVLKNQDNIIIIWYRVDFNNNIISEMMSSLKKNYIDYKTRYDSDEITGARLEEIENNYLAKQFLNNKSIMGEVISTSRLNLNEFIRLGKSLSLFPITHAMNTVSRVLNQDSFKLNEFKKDLENIFQKYQKDNLITLEFRVQIHSKKTE